MPYKWFQDEPHHQHYALAESKREKALMMGAIPVPSCVYPFLYAMLPISGEYGQRYIARWREKAQFNGYAAENIRKAADILSAAALGDLPEPYRRPRKLKRRPDGYILRNEV